MGLESPEPLANLYSRAYFRATWITTALDAGFWSAMKIRNKYLRDISSIIFTAYYLIAAEQADEKVRKIRAVLTVDHLRTSWDKGTTPYLYWFTSLMRPRFMNYGPRRLNIPRPKGSSYKEPVAAWMYFDGSLAELKQQRNLVLDVPGGGFVAMNPRTSDDKLLSWAGKTRVPILSLDYRKAPEYPYPYALNECFDVYTMIVATRGRCVGMEPISCPRIIITGDSAGGNLAVGTTLMVIQSQSINSGQGPALPSPAGVVLMYPALDMNIGSWMTDDQMALIKNPRTAKKHENFVKRKSEDIDKRYTPRTPRPQDEHDEDDYFSSHANGHPKSKGNNDKDIESQSRSLANSKPKPLKSRLAVSSIISYFNDRILTPEMMRAMIILYVGPYNRPDFSTDHLLCPVVAPEALLAKFPKTCILTGERDPLVDDTVIFAGRLRQAKLHLFNERKDLGLEKSNKEFDERDHVEVVLIPGISHGFVQFVSIFPEGWKHIDRCSRWITQIFDAPPHAMEGMAMEFRLRQGSLPNDSTSSLDMGSTNNRRRKKGRHPRRTVSGESSADEDAPLAMSAMRGSPQPQKLIEKPEPDEEQDEEGLEEDEDEVEEGERQQEQQDYLADLRTESHRRKERDKNKSMTSLTSEDDLLKRRMKGLTFALAGSGQI